MNTELRVPDVVRIDDWTWRVKTVGEYHIDVLRMIYNYRIVMTPTARPFEYDYGWCYHGGFVGTVLAAHAWSGELGSEPVGFFKRSGIPQPEFAHEGAYPGGVTP